MSHPTFIDNRDGNTLARALGTVLGVRVEHQLGESTELPDQVRIATAFFSPTGFGHIADQLALVPEVRLLLGTDVMVGVPEDRKQLNETQERFERRRIEEGLRRITDGLERERNHLPFTRTNGAVLAKLIKALRAGNMEVRRYEKAFLHAKAYIFTPLDGTYGKTEGVIAGSSNLTGAGLTRNLELNLGRFDRPIVEEARNWFDDLWDEAKPYDLARLFEVVFEPRSPWDIFIRVLWQLYGDEVEDDVRIDQNLPLTSFQKHGVSRALRLIRDTGGVIVADEVGLGKTFIGGEILQTLSGPAPAGASNLSGGTSRQHMEKVSEHLSAIRGMPVVRAIGKRRSAKGQAAPERGSNSPSTAVGRIPTRHCR